MMRRLLFIMLCLTGAMAPVYANIATVGYLHNYIKNRWGIELPHTRDGVFDMSYLMGIIDKSNVTLNGAPGTTYASDAARTTSHIVATSVSNAAVETLIKPEYKFFFTPATDGDTYAFKMSAAGVFVVDWGDAVEIIVKKEPDDIEYSHTYTDGKPASAHEIKLAGQATRYIASQNSITTPAISFSGTGRDLSGMRGCLGCVFSTITDTSVYGPSRQPMFTKTFYNNKSLTTAIPPELFKGLSGKSAPLGMFDATFYGCSNMTGPIPEGLFADISSATNLREMFYGCAKLSGSIPEKLFANMTGTPWQNMFQHTFQGCKGLTGQIPEKLFASLSGQPPAYAFYGTFAGCTGLSGEIPAKLFATFTGAPKIYMFRETFSGCTGLTGPIPSGLFAGISGAPATFAFTSTFSGCTGLTSIPDDLFGDITGTTGIATMFSNMFWDCSGLTGPSARIGKPGEKQYLYERWPNSNTNAYHGATNLSDRACIPTSWGGPGTQEPGTCDTVE